ncbi:MAG: hypothetical protein CSA22_03615 [Deltaproteobacteria bacterium]|nr:MAG: hypothetical protein CSA22_03615 [Deltaproteobacteria bacterium]
MKFPASPVKWLFLVLSLVAGGLGIATLIPHAAAPRANLFSYLSVCPFAPISSSIMFYISYGFFQRPTPDSEQTQR